MLLLYLYCDLVSDYMDYIYIPLCFYFITETGAWASGSIKFTFHYASTLSISGTTASAADVHLHSTMLLLYLDQHCRACLIYNTFTFHYASTLSTITVYTEIAYYNLHSTMLLLYRIRYFHQFAISSIYIPLCFYFIKLTTKSRSYKISNLHSTMLLLYPGTTSAPSTSSIFTFHYASTLSKTGNHPPARFCIYIPLCFYFISPKKLYEETGFEIYIPLCFYFIRHFNV